ncbi:hypothetical protein [uncultured Campylobacter sp.]
MIDNKIYAALKVGFLFKFGEQSAKFKPQNAKFGRVNLSPKV